MNAKDQQRLRDLAGRYAAYACCETMNERREKWRLHNRLQEKTFPFHIEDNGSCFRDLTGHPEGSRHSSRNRRVFHRQSLRQR